MSSHSPNSQVDPVGEVFHHLRMSGAFYCRSELTSPFGVELPALANTLMFHVVTAGECWLEVPGEEAKCLKPGELALIPHGRGHRLLSQPGLPARDLFDLPRQLVSERYETLDHGGGGTRTTMLCGAVRFDHPAASDLLQQLPNLLVVSAWSAPEAAWLQSTLTFLSHEAQQLRVGGETIITRLCDVLVIQAVRSWIESKPELPGGWMSALRDPQIGKAIALVHREPEVPWTVSTLAKACAMSRSAFAARFTQLLGESPMRFVTKWRMHKAHEWLRGSDTPLSQIARRLGYSSEAAFSRTFKKVMGLPPGAARAVTMNPGFD